MCTVTVLPETVLSAAPARTGAFLHRVAPAGHTREATRLRLRVAFNRDELIARSPAEPPALARVGPRHAIMPLDPDSGGTWIGVNDAGLVCAMLNVHDGRAGIPSPISRGTIIPPLLGCGDLDSVLARASHLPADRYQPFRLVASDGHELVECWNTGTAIDHTRQRLQQPVMRTSSGLGDRLVIGPRAALFERFMRGTHDPIAATDLFHLHHWRGREDISVRMRRADARTVSHTVVEVDAAVVRMIYRPAESADAVSVSVAA